jgi:hypothetical protein
MKELYIKYNHDTGNSPDVLSYEIEDLKYQSTFVSSYIQWLEEKLEVIKTDQIYTVQPLTGTQAIRNLRSNLKGFHL